MNFGEIFGQLQKRRVIRTAIIYIALLWVALQAADLFADAGIISERAVRWLIVAGTVGLPLVLAGSWSLDTPWKRRRWTSMLGDVSVIVAVAIAAFLFVWQQWFTSFTRPVIAMLVIEATDTRADTQQLADHLAGRIRMLLATRPELRVVELSSSHHSQLEGETVSSKASDLNADYLVAGTLSRGGESLRLTLLLHDREGTTIWSDVFTERLVDLSQLESASLVGVAARLPLPDKAINELRQVVESCDYPADSDAIMAIGGSKDLAGHLTEYTDTGLLYLAQATRIFDSIQTVPAPRRPVLQSLAMQHLSDARRICPDLAELELLRIVNTREPVTDLALFVRFPNEAELYRRAAASFDEEASALYSEAHALDPTNVETLCYFEEQQSEAILDKFAPDGCGN